MSGTIVKCPGCLATLRVRSPNAGRRIECPRCGEPITVPEESDSPPAAPVRPAPRVQRRAPASEPDSGRPAGRTGGRAARPQTRTGRTRYSEEADDDPRDDASAVARRARRETQIFFAVLALMLVVLGGGITAGVKWYRAKDSGDVAAAAVPDPDASGVPGAEPAPQPSPVPLAPDRNALAAGDSGDNHPAAVTSGSAPEPAPASFAGVPLTPDPSPPAPGFSVPPAPGFSVPNSAAAPGAGRSPDRRTTLPDPQLAARRLRYQWRPGAEHIFKLEITAGREPETTRVSGTCTYQVRGPAPRSTDVQEGSGTGFVIDSSGVLVTCAHVVEGATRIDVVLNGTTFPGEVIAADRQSDLALIRIRATRLATVPLGNSSHVRLSEGVRVVGYPLSDLLGESVKVTAGTVSGIVDDGLSGQRLQIDAPINPGNSGGPVVDEAGNVIGVASAKLSGVDVSAVGFAVPVSALQAFLATHGVTPSGTPGSARLSGPEIAARVTPTAAQIRVQGRPTGDIWNVGFSTSFVETESIRPGGFRPGMFPSMPSHTSDHGEFDVDEFGHVHRFTGTEHLPFVLGPAALLFLEQLDPSSMTNWTIQEESTLQRIRRSERNDPFGFGGRLPRFRPPSFGPRGFDPFGQREPDEVIEEIPAVETVHYRVGSELNQRLSLTRQYEFRTTRDSSRPYLKVQGQGTVVFDLNVGMPQSLDYSGTIQTNNEDGSSQVPLHVTWSLRDPEEVRQEREAARQKAEADRARKEQERTVPDSNLIGQLLADLRAAEGGHGAAQPLQRLADIAIVEELRPDVLRAASNHMQNSNSSVSRSATEAFCHWSSDEQIPQLIEILKSDDAFSGNAKKKVVSRLASTGDPKHYGILIEAMKDFGLRGDISQALQNAGEAVEPVVLEKFASVTDHSTQRELLQVLQKVGTEKSISFLQDTATGREVSLRSYAQRALDAIRSRL